MENDEKKEAAAVSAEAAAEEKKPEPASADAAESGAKTEAEGGESAGAAKSEEKPKSDAETIAELQAKVAELNDLYLRKCADFDNYRKRMVKEKQDAFDYANTGILTDLVSVLDNFELCLASCEKAADAKTVADGVKMISSQLYSMLESKHSLSVYGKAGDEFDPNLHEALASAPKDGVEKPTCAEIYQKGYKLHERVIRYAKVRVEMPVSAEPSPQ